MSADHPDDTYPGGDACPRCRTEQLRAWNELSEAEHIVVERLPASAHYSLGERRARHRWCRRCWYEAARPAAHDA